MKLLLLLTMNFAIIINVFAQDPQRFKDEVRSLVSALETKSSDSVSLFTGSSSIRMWTDLEQRFPKKTIINTGFGGSHMSDLIYYYDQLIKPFNPSKIFIYEGDNDISSGKKPKKILKGAKTLVKKIHSDFPQAEIYFLSAKPSPSRWDLKENYENLNELYAAYAADNDKITYVNVWSIMLNDEGRPKSDIFIEDNLHMNKSGYDLWENVIEKYL